MLGLRMLFDSNWILSSKLTCPKDPCKGYFPTFPLECGHDIRKHTSKIDFHETCWVPMTHPWDWYIYLHLKYKTQPFM